MPDLVNGYPDHSKAAGTYFENSFAERNGVYYTFIPDNLMEVDVCEDFLYQTGGCSSVKLNHSVTKMVRKVHSTQKYFYSGRRFRWNHMLSGPKEPREHHLEEAVRHAHRARLESGGRKDVQGQPLQQLAHTKGKPCTLEQR